MTPGVRAAYDRLPTTMRELADAGIVFATMDLNSVATALDHLTATGLYARPGHRATPVEPTQLVRQKNLVTAAIAYRDACVRMANDLAEGTTP